MTYVVRALLKRASRLNGALAMGDDLTAIEADNLTTAYNNMCGAMHGKIIGTKLTMMPLTASLTGEPGGSYQCALSAIATLTMPANPQAGSRVGFADTKANFNTYNLTVNPNSRLIGDAASNLTVSTNGTSRIYWYNPERGWLQEAPALIDDNCAYPDSLAGYLPDMLALFCVGEYGGEVRPEVVARAKEGREAFARDLGRQGRNQSSAPMVGAN